MTIILILLVFSTFALMPALSAWFGLYMRERLRRKQRGEQ